MWRRREGRCVFVIQIIDEARNRLLHLLDDTSAAPALIDMLLDPSCLGGAKFPIDVQKQVCVRWMLEQTEWTRHRSPSSSAGSRVSAIQPPSRSSRRESRRSLDIGSLLSGATGTRAAVPANLSVLRATVWFAVLPRPIPQGPVQYLASIPRVPAILSHPRTGGISGCGLHPRPCCGPLERSKLWDSSHCARLDVVGLGARTPPA